jgi:PAS domain S-box-containing protein
VIPGPRFSRLHRVGWCITALFVLCAHFLALTLLRNPALASNLTAAVAPALAVFVCLLAGTRTAGTIRARWLLASSSFLLWTAGQVVVLYYENYRHVAVPIPSPTDFLFFLYGLPLLLAICFVDEPMAMGVIRGLDLWQAGIAVLLVYLHVFYFPADGTHHHDGLAANLLFIYHAENLVLAVAAFLRVWGERKGSPVRGFYVRLAWFLGLYAVCAAIANCAAWFNNIHTGTLLDLLWTVPFLVFLAAGPPVKVAGDAEAVPHAVSRPVHLLLAHASPLVLFGCVLAIGAFTARSEFALGMGAIAGSLLLFCARAWIVQMRYQQAAEALRESQEGLQSIVDAIPAAVEYIDAAGVRRWSNRTSLEWWGREPQHAIGRSTLEILSQIAGSTHSERIRPMLEAAMQGSTVTLEAKHQTGEVTRHVATTCTPDRAPSGQVRGFIALGIDITERKAAEDRLRASEERFRTLAEAIPSIVWSSSPDGHAEYFSERFQQVTGSQAGLGLGWEQLLHPDDVVPERVLREASLTSGKPYEARYRIRQRDHSYRWYLARALGRRCNRYP